jgi:hypothetical protein
MSLVTKFRLIIVVGLFCLFFTGITEFFYRPYVTEEMKAFLEWEGYGNVLKDALVEALPEGTRIARVAVGTVMILVLGLMLIILFVQIAMLWFSRLGRTLSLISAGLWVLLGPFAGVSASLPIENAAGYLAAICEGGALAMAYFSPLSERFAVSPNSSYMDSLQKTRD